MKAIGISIIMSARCGSLATARRNYLGVRLVPEAEVSPGILNVGLWKSGRSDLNDQWLLCAQWRRSALPISSSTSRF
jgi:hypothetical protein